MSSLASGNSSKAGLPQSFEEINQIIKEASKESKFTAAQERKAEQLQQRISALKSDLQTAMYQAKLVAKARRQVDELIGEFEAQQLAQFASHESECAVCVDMDAFFAAVECLDAPELRTIPMAVGSSAMLSTANYEARKFGVSAAMPGYIAIKLCPQLRIVPLNYEKYQKYSAQVSAILAEYDASLTMFSLDEAFLHLKRGPNDPNFAEIVDEMRARVKAETGLTCSAGIASNILLAKMASNIKKPDGQFEIPRESVQEMRAFLHAQPVKKISGIGKVMAALLEGVLNIVSIGDLYQNRHLLPLIFKEKTVQFLVACSIGHQNSSYFRDDDDSFSSADQQRQSISCERTFLPASRDPEVLRSYLLEIVENLQEDVHRTGIIGCSNVGLKVKSADFKVSTREKRTESLSRSLDWPLILKIAERQLDDYLHSDAQVKIRLIGVRLSKLKFSESSISASSENHHPTGLEKWLQSANPQNQNNSNTGNLTTCPVCNCALPLTIVEDDRAMNAHLDECLTRATLKAENVQ